jgi:class 3 adenylate cyclase
MLCANCKADNPAGQKFCGDCGAALANLCPRCGADNSAGKRFCGECGGALTSATARTKTSNQTPIVVERSSADLEGERKTVTALFADIKGSMELMEDLDPEEARVLVDPAFKLTIDAAHRYDGYIVQSTGDGIFALFGAPVAHEDHPQRALYAALRMQEELKRHSDRIRADGGPPIQVRVGVNTGEVVVRSLRTADAHTEYTPIGHSINLASRMQTVAPIGSIAATEAVRKLCEGYFIFKSLGPARIKGVNEAVNVYEVTGLGPLRTRLQRAAGRGLTKFVGREREIDAMTHAAQHAREGHGQIVAAVAEPGVGKSRLFFEFKAKNQSGWMVLEAFSVSHGKASAYLPVTDLLDSYFEIEWADDARKRRERIAGKITMLDRALEDTLPYLFSLLGIVEGYDPLAQMDASIRKRRTLDAIKRIVLRESLNQPLMVIFEDLHWIDEQTQEFLNLFADSIANARILLLVNYRPAEYSHQWNSKTYYTQSRLDPLGKESADEMLSALLGDNTELAPLKRMIIEWTEGNPFFMEETVQVLLDEGALARNGALHLTKPISELKIPPTVQAILASRIDRLHADAKELLQTLAVIGREFPLALIRAAVQKSDDDLNRVLSELQLGEFIYEQPAVGDTEYIFKHALTQGVAYNSILQERRKLIHERIAAVVEATFADRLDDHLKDLAHHYRHSNNTLKAVEFLRRAGEQGLGRGFYEEAIEQLNSGLALLEKLNVGRERDLHEVAIRTALMGSLIAARSLVSPEIELNSERLRELCERLDEPQNLALVLLHLFFFHRSATGRDKAGTYARRALELAEANRGEVAIFCGNFSSGMIAAERAQYPAAREHLVRAVGISQPALDLILSDPSVALGFLNCTGYLAIVDWVLGYPDRARRGCDRLTELLRRSLPANAYAIGVFHLLAMRCDLFREYQGTRAQAQEAVEHLTQSGFGWGVAFTTLRLASIMVAEGAAAAGLEKLAETLATSETDVDRHYTYLLSAGAYLKARRVVEGRATCEKAIAGIAAGDSRLYETELYRIKGELALIAGEPLGNAEGAFNSAIAIARRQQAKSFELRSTMSLARLMRETNRRDEARAMLADIYNWFTEGFDTADLKGAKALLDELGN